MNTRPRSFRYGEYPKARTKVIAWRADASHCMSLALLALALSLLFTLVIGAPPYKAPFF